MLQRLYTEGAKRDIEAGIVKQAAQCIVQLIVVLVLVGMVLVPYTYASDFRKAPKQLIKVSIPSSWT